ncbi:hypothetical protein EKO27_g161 [Xylaria grammica]|uniref:Uncharacterized protein n=1 Tax=Xylaria grammica TaxID=363999 RepID=A0A439DKH1_9PEZI|nr:hypothetical protein EKO27_g161 [Xylaria grammica]
MPTANIDANNIFFFFRNCKLAIFCDEDDHGGEGEGSGAGNAEDAEIKQEDGESDEDACDDVYTTPG